MLSRRITASRTLLPGSLVGNTLRLPIAQRRCISQADIDDPGMNGGYINPPPIKRQHRDPYEKYFDQQERRNYGEPVHEDDDILGMFSPYEYTHTKPGKGLFQIGCFVVVVLGLCGVVSMTYPDKPSAAREFEGGLEAELGGPTAVRAHAAGDE